MALKNLKEEWKHRLNIIKEMKEKGFETISIKTKKRDVASLGEDASKLKKFMHKLKVVHHIATHDFERINLDESFKYKKILDDYKDLKKIQEQENFVGHEQEAAAAVVAEETNSLSSIKEILQGDDKDKELKFQKYLDLLAEENKLVSNHGMSEKTKESYHKAKLQQLFPDDFKEIQKQEAVLKEVENEKLKEAQKAFKNPFYIEDGKNVDERLLKTKTVVTATVGGQRVTREKNIGLVTKENVEKYTKLIEEENKAINKAAKEKNPMTTEDIEKMHLKNLEKTFGASKANEISRIEKEITKVREREELKKQNEPKEFKAINQRVNDMEKNKKEIISIVGNEKNYDKFMNVMKKEAELKKEDVNNNKVKGSFESKKQFRQLLEDEFGKDHKTRLALYQYYNGEHAVQIAPKQKQKESPDLSK